ncbi:OmpA/MotB family protein [Thalassobaculum sp.]|uniref:OmpA/MotB family protein n=1 Tax=Thalassobaculum sp. TaxID=2022740 RepID=UPI003B5C5422
MTVQLSHARTTVSRGERKLGRRAGRKYGGGASWMVTLVDLVSLMLAFFVLRFAMTNIDTPSFEKAAGAIALVLGREVSAVDQTPPVELSVSAERTRRGFSLGYLEPVLDAKMSADPVLNQAKIAQAGEQLVIALPADLLFPVGGAELTREARVAVGVLSSALSTLPNRIDVVGYADPQPMTGSGRYATNWELSLARADAVAARLMQTGYPRQPTVEGRGDSRFSEVAPTLDMERRFELARRVDVVIFPERAP